MYYCSVESINSLILAKIISSLCTRLKLDLFLVIQAKEQEKKNWLSFMKGNKTVAKNSTKKSIFASPDNFEGKVCRFSFSFGTELIEEHPILAVIESVPFLYKSGLETWYMHQMYL